MTQKDDNKLKDKDILRRYMDFAKFVDLVYNENLYFPRADSFDDNHEGTYTRLNYEVGKCITFDGNNNGMHKETKRIRTGAYVSCWTKSEYESMAHWKIYGGDNSVAITTTVGELKKQLIENCTHKIADIFMTRVIEPVEYIDHRAIDNKLAIELLKDDLNPLKKKNIAFRYEEEVRIIYSHLHYNIGDFNEKLGKGFAVGIDCKKLVGQILISPVADSWFYDLVVQFRNKYELPAEIKWSALRCSPNEEVFVEK